MLRGSGSGESRIWLYLTSKEDHYNIIVVIEVYKPAKTLYAGTRRTDHLKTAFSATAEKPFSLFRFKPTDEICMGQTNMKGNSNNEKA